MKRIIIIMSCIGALVLASCKDFLTEKPQTSLSDKQIFDNATDANLALIGCYSYLQAYNVYGRIESWNLQMASLFLTYGPDPSVSTNQSQDGCQWSQLNIPPTSTLINDNTGSSMYQCLFLEISYINNAIFGIENGSIAQDVKDKMTGELRFLRAVVYFDIVRMWGAVPMPLTPPVVMADASKPKTPANEIFEQIVSDLRIAFNTMPDRDEQVHGRPCKWAALAILAKVYNAMATSQYYFVKPNADGTYSQDSRDPHMYPDGDPWNDADRTAFWQASYDCADSVVRYGGYTLTHNYSDLFRYRFVCTNESIFEVPYGHSIAGAAGFSGRFGPGMSPGYMPFTPNNNNFNQIRVSRAAYWSHHNKYCKGDPTTDLSTLTADSLNKWVMNQDPRLLETYCPPVMNCWAGPGSTTTFKMPVYPHDDAWSTNNAFQTNGRLAICMKFCDPLMTGVNGGGSSWVVMRYADLLLTLAEAANEIGKTAEAVGYVNQIMARARQSQPYVVAGQIMEQYWQRPANTDAIEPKDWSTTDYYVNGAANAWTKEALRDSIMMERRFELLGEGTEFFDVRRRGPEYFKKMIDMVNYFALDSTYGVKPDSLTVLTGSDPTLPTPLSTSPSTLTVISQTNAFAQLTNTANYGKFWGVRWDAVNQRWLLLTSVFNATTKTWSDVPTVKSIRRNIIPNDNATVNRSLFLPIPQLELSNNTALGPEDQNPGY